MEARGKDLLTVAVALQIHCCHCMHAGCTLNAHRMQTHVGHMHLHCAHTACTCRVHGTCMHLGQVKIWMRQHDCGADWELPEAEQHQLKEWFNALDIDGSGGAAAC